MLKLLALEKTEPDIPDPENIFFIIVTFEQSLNISLHNIPSILPHPSKVDSSEVKIGLN